MIFMLTLLLLPAYKRLDKKYLYSLMFPNNYMLL